MICVKKSVFMIITMMFIAIAVFCVRGTVVSQSRIGDEAKEKYRKEMEKEYVANVREFLAEQGFCNSGVTLTSVMDGEGGRTYTATIHHARIDRMTKEERVSLQDQLNLLTFIEEENVIHKFLVLNQ